MNISNLKHIQITELPDEVFLNGTQVLDIMRARIITRAERKQLGRGTPDILLKSYSGAETHITRRALMEKFTGLDGKKIVLGGWKTGKNYLVYRKLANNISIVHSPRIPKYVLILPNKKMLKPGYYFVCNRNETGKILRDTGIQLGPTLFKKMCIIEDSVSKLTARTKLAIANDTIAKKVEAGNQTNTNKAVGKVNRVASTSGNVPVGNVRINELARLNITGKVLNSQGQLVGYVVSDGKIEKPIPKNNVIEMCRKKQIRNMSLVDVNGKEFLRGIGITHESLPTKYI